MVGRLSRKLCRASGILAVLLVALALMAAPTHADFAGLAAYKAGDYAKAYAEWLPVARQGDANAQFNLGMRCTEPWPAAASRAGPELTRDVATATTDNRHFPKLDCATCRSSTHFDQTALLGRGCLQAASRN